MKRKVLKQLVCVLGILFMTFPAWSAVPSNLLPDAGSLNQTPVIADFEDDMILAAKGGGGSGGGGQGGSGSGGDNGGGGDNGNGGNGSGGGEGNQGGDNGGGGSDNGSGDGDGDKDQVRVRARKQTRAILRIQNCESESCEQGDPVRTREMTEENSRNSENAQDDTQ